MDMVAITFCDDKKRRPGNEAQTLQYTRNVFSQTSEGKLGCTCQMTVGPVPLREPVLIVRSWTGTYVTR